MTVSVKNPAALRLLIGWVVIAALTIGVLVYARLLPPHPGFRSIFLPTLGALLFQGVAALMAVKQSHVRLGWIILLLPTFLMVAAVVLFFVLFAIGIS